MAQVKQITFENAAAQLIEHIPEYKAIYDQKREAFGEEAQYVIFGLPFVQFLREVVQHKAANDTLLKRAFFFIEQCANTDDEDILALIRTGFLEDLIKSGTDEETFVSYMGAKTKSLLAEIKVWWAKFAEANEKNDLPR